ncbi:MAG TPA: DUF3147 family protein [Rhizomicrobium sp.]|jgi:hypothetical protein|nr:DUF3147 family protein [Rhizomicrobium sp.]
MLIHIRLAALKETTAREYLIRFVLGGLATAATGAIARFFGPDAGGLFLAFPAILCASLTLIAKHERERKEKKGLKGTARGKEAAALDAAGASLGSVGLAAFGWTVWREADRGWPVLALALLAWVVVSLTLWLLWRRYRDRW